MPQPAADRLSPRPSPHQAGLYIHVPFCSAVCPYCDFAVQVGKPAARRPFVDSLCADIVGMAPTWQGHGARAPRALTFDTIYFGGGTPSYLQGDELAEVLATARRHLPVSDTARIFFEANPEDIDGPRLDAWRRLGIATLSLGVQSFNDDDLTFLGRRHDARTARQAVEMASTADFATLSIDLIYGLPGQNMTSWRRTLDEALDLEPDHLSCYELTIHANTSFGKQLARGALQPLADPAQAELFIATHRRLEERGYPGYEVSNFARNGDHISRHNRKYWDHTPYLGVGPSAHSYANGERWWNERSLATWQRRLHREGSAVADSERLSRVDMALEAIMLGLRTRQGLDLSRLRSDYGCDLLGHNGQRIERGIEAGLLRLERDHLRATLDGWIVADALTADLQIEISDD